MIGRLIWPEDETANGRGGLFSASQGEKNWNFICSEMKSESYA